MKQLLGLVLAIGMAFAVTACDDKGTRPSRTPTTSNYKDLTEPWHVLHNLARAYDDENITRVEDLMDDASFIFYFDPGEVGEEYIPPTGQWDYTAEIQATTNMFNGDGGGESNPILSIDVTLFDIETVEWVGIVNHPDFPGESLQQATVVYDYFIDTEQDRQFITSGAPQVRVLVRNVGGKWKIARWYDELDGFAQRAAVSAEATSWGRIKALYQ